MAALETALPRAFERIEDFLAVQRGRDFDELVEAIICLQESVSIDNSARRLIRDRLPRITPHPDALGGFMLGLIVGLTAAQLEREMVTA